MEPKNQKNVVESILFEAIEENYCTYVQNLLWQGSDVLGRNEKNESTFFVAAKFNSVKTAEVLFLHLNNYVELDPHWKVYYEILKNIFFNDDPANIIELLNLYEFATAESPLVFAIFLNRKKHIKIFLDKKPCDLYKFDILGRCPLHWAVQCTHIESVQFFVKKIW